MVGKMHKMHVGVCTPHSMAMKKNDEFSGNVSLHDVTVTAYQNRLVPYCNVITGKLTNQDRNKQTDMWLLHLSGLRTVISPASEVGVIDLVLSVSVSGCTQGTLYTTTTVYGLLVHQEGAICTTQPQYAPRCTRETMFFEKFRGP